MKGRNKYTVESITLRVVGNKVGPNLLRNNNKNDRAQPTTQPSLLTIVPPAVKQTASLLNCPCGLLGDVIESAETQFVLS